MIRIKEIQDKLMNVVGWEQTYNPVKMISQSLTESESGLYYQGAHPLLTLDNIEAIMPDDFEMKFPLWNMIVPYVKGNKVRHGEYVYIAWEDNEGIEPTSTDFSDDFYEDDFGGTWMRYNFASDYLEQETRKGIATAIQKFVREQTLAKGTRDVLLQESFYKDTYETRELPQLYDKSGFYIRSNRSAGVTARINRVSLQFTKPGKVTLHIAKDLQSVPERSFELDYTNTQARPQWFELDDVYLSGPGEWVMYYDHAELDTDMRAIVAKTTGLGATANICGGKKFIDVSPIDLSHKSGGLNATVTVGCDLTDFIIEQRSMFATVLQLQVAEVLLRTMALNPNVKINRHQSNVSRMDILYEIDGNTQGERPGGLGHDLKKAYEALKLDVTGLDAYCLPCRRKGVRYGVA